MNSRALVSRPSVPRALGGLDDRVTDMETGLGLWNYPELEGAWFWPGAPYSQPAYRRGIGPNAFEFKGALAGGVSGSDAFHLLEEFWPTYNLAWVAPMKNGAVVQGALVEVAAADGAVTITFPLT